MRRNKINGICIFLSFFLLMLCSCSSKKELSRPSAADVALAEIVASSPSVVSADRCLSAGVRLYADVGDNSMSARGTMRIKHDEGVQIGITALGLVEVACLEFFPSSVRVINKIGREYSDISYSNVDFLHRTGIDYAMLESVLMNRIFSPDGMAIADMLKKADIRSLGDTILISLPEYKGIAYNFLIDKTSSNLIQSEGIYSNGAKVMCSYDDFQEVETKLFPRVITMTLSGTGKRVSLKFELNNINFDDFLFSPRKLSSGYRKQESTDLLKSLGNF